MRLGLGSYACAWAIGVPGCPARADPMDAPGLLHRADDLGLRLVQVCDNLPLDAMAPEALDRLAQRADAWGIAVTVGTRGIAPAHLRRYLALAQRFRSPIVRVVVDTAEHQSSADEVVEALRALAGEFDAANVRLAIENHDRFSSAALADIVRRIDSDHVGICLDTVNSFGALEGPEHVVEILAPWVIDLHIKDFAIYRPPHKMGFIVEGRPAGQGRLDVPWLLEALRTQGNGRLGRACDAILELWPPPQETMAATVALEAAWCRDSVEYLRTLIPD